MNFCEDCVQDDYLVSCIRKDGESNKCDSRDCPHQDETVVTLHIDLLTEIIRPRFHEHFEKTNSEPNDLEYMMLRDKELGNDWYREGEPLRNILEDHLGLPDPLVSELLKTLPDNDHDSAINGYETELDAEAMYQEVLPQLGVYRELWNEFRKISTSQTRHFNSRIKILLDRILGDIVDRDPNRKIIVTIGPGEEIFSLFRARDFSNRKNMEKAFLSPEKELGPPPTGGVNFGRMNAIGVSMFYGSSDIETTLAEIRPPVGYFVASAKFNITRPLQVLNLGALGKIVDILSLSLLDPENALHLDRQELFLTLEDELARPVDPERSANAYLPTQILSDYISNCLGLDGMIYKSSQGGEGKNIVLFSKASRVEQPEYPEGTKRKFRVSQLSEDYDDVELRADITTPSESELAKLEEKRNDWEYTALNHSFVNDDTRVDSLRFDSDSLQSHHVKSVNVNVETLPVKYSVEQKNDNGVYPF